ncbi:hypothetical protein G647_03797 [Cladophialophora carrionii CBS 160.54]|uniref:Uncharacterized protein n=1 Tax=Cladophialophora carrionii CBS 160.54 TaxID=1279043 RepID=V9DDN8_9EURO|nr:uncharacterized protein G647_03797 [Cladophialophora carrionii CBS 160.54]ETI24428.1 hypothetical protein G647_03797 [Cladophialophora carrionii CBS 160.54]
MEPEDRITTRSARGQHHLNGSNSPQAPCPGKVHIYKAEGSLVSNARHNKRAITVQEEENGDGDNAASAMSKTTTQLEHPQMRLSATALGAESPVAIAATSAAAATVGLERSHPSDEKTNVVANPRRPSDISLAIMINVTRGKSPLSTTVTITTTTPASKCRVWSELRAAVVAASSEATGVNNYANLANLTVKLEEDGHAACMTITPTKIDAQTAFRSRTYEAWYHRIMRGKQSIYVVDVKMDVSS